MIKANVIGCLILLVVCVAFLLIAILPTTSRLRRKSVIFKNGNYQVVDDFRGRVPWVAHIKYDNKIHTTGWQTIVVQTNPEYVDDTTAYWAGYLEGFVATEEIYNSWRNMQEGFCHLHGRQFCINVDDYLQENISWMTNQIEKYKETSSYWYQVNLILAQLNGLHAGYTANRGNLKAISIKDMLLMNLFGDMLDLVDALAPLHERKTLEENVELGNRFVDGRCSALIKVLPNNKELLVSHVTWNLYQSMLRNIKKYNFPFKSNNSDAAKTIPGHTAIFSSYPTYLGSGDDFIQLSSGLVALETTIGNSNPELWKYVQPTGQVQEWIRVIVANRLATSGKEWTDLFQKYNSGTYNNQWMIVDYNKFESGKPIRSDTLWVVEQLPGKTVSKDQSNILRTQTYWPSYNVPFYPEIYNLSGLPAFAEKYGDFYTYDNSPRALIFKRDHSKVTDLDSLIHLMRYNDYKNDPLSRCNCTPPFSAENAISARDDLNPANGSYPFPALGHRSHGGIDVKATSYELFKSKTFGAISSPTNQQQVFKWSEQDFANYTPHYMHPDIWDFPIVYPDFYYS